MLIDKITENFNLNDKEAIVYLSALELGRSKVSEIAKKSNLNRITTYEILKRLRNRGIISMSTYEKTLTFQAIDPEKLVEKMERQVSLSKTLLPQLLMLKCGEGSKPKIDFYEGLSGIKTIYEDTLFCKDKTIYDIVHPDNLLETIGNDFSDNYVKRRVRRKINVKILIPSENSKRFTADQKIKRREIRTFNDSIYKIPTEIMIYDNKIALLSFKSRIGIIVEDVELSQSLKSIWSFIWDKSQQE